MNELDFLHRFSKSAHEDNFKEKETVVVDTLYSIVLYTVVQTFLFLLFCTSFHDPRLLMALRYEKNIHTNK